jgi:predicted HTH transcriptional regulator
MPLWNTDVDKITFDDVNAFLSAQKTESDRLDYKAALPTELNKSIAAFANHNAGLIILGVDENKNTNTPVWPPDQNNSAFLQGNQAGLRDTITRISYEHIYPPVTAIQVSNVLPNRLVPGDKVIVVIRVEQSSEAPHAIDHKKSVYVVDRVGATTDRFVLADIDRIEALLNRRRTLVEQRDQAIEKELRRRLAISASGFGHSFGLQSFRHILGVIFTRRCH